MASETTRWWWIRHAPVDNPDRRLYGQQDLSADVGDVESFRHLAEHLPADAVWLTSHLKRTHQTAEAVRPHLEARGFSIPEPRAMAEIAEQNFGNWQGMNYEELQAHLGDEFYTFMAAPARARPPEGESFSAVIGRVADAVTQITAAHKGRDIVAFAHGGSIRAALALALGLEPDAALHFQIDNLSLTRIDLITMEDGSRGWRIGVVNHRPIPGEIVHPRR